VDAAKGDLLAVDHDHPVADARHCTRIGSDGGRGGGPAGRVVEHQGGGLDADADQLPGEASSGVLSRG
jgi:hypothetical protein